MRLLGSLLRPLRGRVVLALVVVVVSTALQVAGPALIALGIDQGLPALMNGRLDADRSRRRRLPARGDRRCRADRAVHDARRLGSVRQLLLDLRKRIFLHAQRLSLEFHESYTSGRIIARQTSDLDSIRELLDSGINGLVRGVLYMVFIAIALVALDPWSGLVIAGSLPSAGAADPLVPEALAGAVPGRPACPRHGSSCKFVETMTGIRAVKAFRNEKRNEKEFGDVVEDYRDANAQGDRPVRHLRPRAWC